MLAAPGRLRISPRGLSDSQQSLDVLRLAAPGARLLLFQRRDGSGEEASLFSRHGQALADVGRETGIAPPGASGKRPGGERRCIDLALGVDGDPGGLGDDDPKRL